MTFKALVSDPIAVPDPEEKPLLTIDEVALVLGVGRSTLYAAVKEGRAPFPVLQVSDRRLLVPTAGLREALGLPRSKGRGDGLPRGGV